MFIKPKVRPTFDELASDEIKAIRLTIFEAARELLAKAATAAMTGDVEGACNLHDSASALRHRAISITLDMLETERDGLKPFKFEPTT